MALIKCPECGKEVSDKAVNCINCGYPISENIEKVEIEKESEDAEIMEDSYFTVCNKCSNFAFTKKIRIDNTIASTGYPTCMWCGGEIKILAGKNQWMRKDKREREDIVQEEIQRVKNNPKYDVQKANEYGRRFRPDLDVQGYCPKCATDYSKSTALKEGRTTCEFCGTEIEYSDMLVSDFGQLFEEEKKRLGIDIPLNREPIERLIIKTFLLDNNQFNEVLFDKKWHPERYKEEPKQTEKYIPKCPTCGSADIKKISAASKAGSAFMWGLFSRKVHKQWHCNNCGSEW